jgi:hypothetical protein
MRKVIVLIFASILLVSNLNAQEAVATEQMAIPAKKNFLGFGTGVNSDTGIFGAMATFGLSEKAMFGIAGGIGGWGYKAGANFQFHPRGYYKHFFKVGLSVASGISEISLPLETVEYGETDVDLQLNSVFNANLSLGYNFKIGRAARLFLEGGFAINLTDDVYEVLDDVELTSDSKSVMDFQTPGGIRLALGIDFGL